MFDYDDVVSAVSELDGQIKMYGYLWTLCFVDHSVIAHSAHKGDIVPAAKHTVTNMVLWPVAFFIEVICESSHDCIIIYIKKIVKKKPTEVGWVFQRLAMYIEISNPKRISVACGAVHFMISLLVRIDILS